MNKMKVTIKEKILGNIIKRIEANNVLTISNTSKNKLPYSSPTKIIGYYKQETREGYNLVNEENLSLYSYYASNVESLEGNLLKTIALSDGTTTTNIGIDFDDIDIEDGEYYVSADIRLVSGTGSFNSLQISRSGTNEVAVTDVLKPTISNVFQRYCRKYIISNSSSAKAIRILVQFTNTTNAVFEITNFQISKTDKDYEQYGAMPSPDYPSEIEIVTGDVGVSVVNDNLVDFGNADYYKSADYTFENDALTVYSTNKTDWAWNNVYYDILDLVNNNRGKYLYFNFESLDLSKYTSTNSVLIQFYYVLDGTTVGKTLLNTDGNIIPRPIPEEGEITVAQLRIYCNNTSTTGVNSTVVITKPILSFVENTEYVQHQSQNYTLSLGNIELCENDYIYKIDNKFYHHQTMLKVVLDGSEHNVYGWAINTQYNVFYCKCALGGKNSGKCLSSHYLGTNKFYSYLVNNEMSLNIGGADGYILIKDDRFTKVSELISELAENPVTVYYELLEPIEEEITDETLIAQLEALWNAYTYKDVTNIISDAPIEFSYYSNEKLDISNLKISIKELL